MGKMNKGEWSEPYVALKIIGEGRVDIADDEGEKIPGQWLRVLEVIRHETEDRIVKYRYNPSSVDVNIEVNGELVAVVPAIEFLKKSDCLRTDILNGSGRSFDVSDDMYTFFEEIGLKHIKAKSVDKSDIFLSTEDPVTNIVRHHIGFSIKSKFGKDPTLFNTGANSAAIYMLSNMSNNLMDKVNSLYTDRGSVAVMDRCKTLVENDCALSFVGYPIAVRARCKTFEENLDMIDPRLVTVFEFIMRAHFFAKCSARTIEEMMEFVIVHNPCGITRPEEKYPYMMKSFLYAAYCGVTAGTLWDGKSDVNGGFIAVDEKGEVAVNLALESDAFKSYLYKHCYFEWPDTSEGHGNYARVYKEDDFYFFRLNFQIRYS